MTSMKISQFSRPPNPLVHLRPEFSPPPIDLGRPKRRPKLFHLQIITNQFKENIIQGWLLHVIRSFLRSDFILSINSLILSGFPLTFIHLAEATLVLGAILKTSFSPSSYNEKMCWVQDWAEASLSAFCDFMFLCVQLSKNIIKWFLFIIINDF